MNKSVFYAQIDSLLLHNGQPKRATIEDLTNIKNTEGDYAPYPIDRVAIIGIGLIGFASEITKGLTWQGREMFGGKSFLLNKGVDDIWDCYIVDSDKVGLQSEPDFESVEQYMEAKKVQYESAMSTAIKFAEVKYAHQLNAILAISTR